MGGLALEDSDIEQEEEGGGEEAGGQRAGTERAARSLMLDDDHADTLVEEQDEEVPRTSIFSTFQGSDPDGGPAEPAPAVAERGAAVVAEGARRVYGKKPVDQATPEKAVKVPAMFGAGAIAAKKAVVEVYPKP